MVPPVTLTLNHKYVCDTTSSKKCDKHTHSLVLKIRMKKFSILVAAIAVSSCHAFVIGSTPKTAVASSTTAMNMGLINDLKTLFSEEGRANRAAYAEQQRKEMEEAQREILERRTDPEAMGKYEEEIIKRRSKFMEDKSALKLQTEVEVQEESS
jgi:hypothetical protein